MPRRSLVLVALAVVVLGLRPVQAVYSTSSASAPGRITAGSWSTSGTTLSWAGKNNAGQAGESGIQDSVLARLPHEIVADGTFSQVALGKNYGCAIREVAVGTQPAGAAVCWGYNIDGQSGNDTSGGFNSAPVPVKGDPRWTSLAGNDSAVCGVQVDGSLWCWGYWAKGQLGFITGGSLDEPRKVAAPLGTTFSSVSGGGFHFCALTTGGSLYCWGQNDRGQAGTGYVGSSTSPTAEGIALTQVEAGATWSKVSSGFAHTCAIGAGGTLVSGAAVTPGAVYCWGGNDKKQLGDGTTTGRTTPTRVTVLPGTTWTDLAAGKLASCAVRSDGQLWCWGSDARNYYDTTAAAGDVVQVAGTWTALAHATENDLSLCAVASGGVLKCVGQNSGGILGDGSTNNHTTMAPVSGSLTWRAVALGQQFACGISTAKRVLCWGLTDYGQVGTTSQQSWPVLRPASSGAWSSVSTTSDYGHVCAIQGTAAYCWGNGGSGQLGNGAKVDAGTPQLVSGGRAWAVVTAGGKFSCGVDTGGRAWCWGEGGKLGTGDGAGASTPQEVLTVPGTAPGSWRTVEAGSASACGIRTDGTLWCWGDGGSGRLGNGALGSSNKPVQVGSQGGWTSVQVGTGTACGIRAGGQLSCWGDVSSGQLGDGTVPTTGASALVPVRVPVPTGYPNVWADVAVGGAHVCAVDVGGRLWCWGSNGNGQLGDGSTTGRTRPVLAARSDTGGRWTRVTAAADTTCAVGRDGPSGTWGTYCFGSGFYGQFGIGAGVTSQQVPLLLPGGPVNSVTLGRDTLWVVR